MHSLNFAQQPSSFVLPEHCQEIRKQEKKKGRRRSAFGLESGFSAVDTHISPRYFLKKGFADDDRGIRTAREREREREREK